MTSTSNSTTPSGTAGGGGGKLSWPGDVTSFNSGSSRLEGPIPKATESGTPRRAGIYDLESRLERLAFGGRPEGHNAPPMEAYTTTPTEHGDVVRATPEYRLWFMRAYPAARPEDCSRVPAPGPAPKGVGGKEDRSSPLDRFKSP